MNCFITVEPWEMPKVIVYFACYYFIRVNIFKSRNKTFCTYKSLHSPPLRQSKGTH